jgi:hypothetical protein
MFINRIGTWPATSPAEKPIGLTHINSEFCWCDPIIEADEHGRTVVLHKEVTWH